MITATKKNGKLDSIYIWGDEMESLLELLQTLWNDCGLSSTNQRHVKGIEALLCIMRDYQ